jgi:pimeloyl-ACP methyl ester carboxylesterase
LTGDWADCLAAFLDQIEAGDLMGRGGRPIPHRHRPRPLGSIPGAALDPISGAGHVSNLEAPEEFNGAVRALCRAL